MSRTHNAQHTQLGRAAIAWHMYQTALAGKQQTRNKLMPAIQKAKRHMRVINTVPSSRNSTFAVSWMKNALKDDQLQCTNIKVYKCKIRHMSNRLLVHHTWPSGKNIITIVKQTKMPKNTDKLSKIIPKTYQVGQRQKLVRSNEKASKIYLQYVTHWEYSKQNPQEAGLPVLQTGRQN